ncbi:MAG: FMN-binding protein [Candidatus Omnitrophota bacterium]|jgi:electron transport complex protein RnfG
MKEIVRYAFILGLIALTAGGLLAAVNSVTAPRIAAQADLEEETALKELQPEAVSFRPVRRGGEIFFYKAYDSRGKSLGTLFKAAGKGYSGMIETMVCMDERGTVKAIRVLNQNETPGLGSRVAEKPFIERFGGVSADKLAGVQAITGATISSRAVISSVSLKAAEVREALRDGK